MSICRTIRALFDRRQLVGGGGPQPELTAVRYVPSTQLPADVDGLIRAGLAEPWRTDQAGVAWFRVADEDLDAIKAFDQDQDQYDDGLVDVEVFDQDEDEDLFDEDQDDDEDDPDADYYDTEDEDLDYA